MQLGLRISLNKFIYELMSLALTDITLSERNKKVEKKKGSIILLVLFFIGFFGSLALLVYASFHHYVSQIAAPMITFMFMVSGLYIKYIAPKIPTKEILIAVVIFAVAEIISHIVGDKFPPAFLITHVLADILISGTFLARWRKYL